jgi:DHA1 family inner membrane transport protein
VTNWPVVWVIFAGGLAAGAHMTKVPPALPGLRADLGLTLVESGFIHTVMYVVGGTVGVFGGALADRFGRKGFAFAGLVLMAAGGFAGAAAQGYATLLASRFVEGLGFILFTVPAVPLLVAAARAEDRPTALSIWSCYMPTGGTLALLFVPLALATLGWRSLWIGLAVYTIGCAALFFRYVPASVLTHRIGSARLLTESLGRPGVLALCIGFICYTGQWTSLMTWLPTFAVGERDASSGQAALLTAAFVAANIPGNLLGGVLLRFGFSRRAIMVFGAAAMGATSIGLLGSQVPDGLRLACLLAFSTLGGVIPAAIFSGTPVHARSPEHVGTANGMVMQASHIAQFGLPILIAWIASRLGGWSATLQTMLVLSVIGVIAGWALGRFEITRNPTQAS